MNLRRTKLKYSLIAETSSSFKSKRPQIWKNRGKFKSNTMIIASKSLRIFKISVSLKCQRRRLLSQLSFLVPPRPKWVPLVIKKVKGTILRSLNWRCQSRSISSWIKGHPHHSLSWIEILILMIFVWNKQIWENDKTLGNMQFQGGKVNLKNPTKTQLMSSQVLYFHLQSLKKKLGVSSSKSKRSAA